MLKAVYSSLNDVIKPELSNPNLFQGLVNSLEFVPVLELQMVFFSHFCTNSDLL